MGWCHDRTRRTATGGGAESPACASATAAVARRRGGALTVAAHCSTTDEEGKQCDADLGRGSRAKPAGGRHRRLGWLAHHDVPCVEYTVVQGDAAGRDGVGRLEREGECDDARVGEAARIGRERRALGRVAGGVPTELPCCCRARWCSLVAQCAAAARRGGDDRRGQTARTEGPQHLAEQPRVRGDDCKRRRRGGRATRTRAAAFAGVGEQG